MPRQQPEPGRAAPAMAPKKSKITLIAEAKAKAAQKGKATADTADSSSNIIKAKFDQCAVARSSAPGRGHHCTRCI